MIDFQGIRFSHTVSLTRCIPHLAWHDCIVYLANQISNYLFINTYYIFVYNIYLNVYNVYVDI